MSTNHFIMALTALVVALAAVLVVLLSSGCSECKVAASFRCSGDVLEVCDDDHRWAESQDCGIIVGAVDHESWVCCDSSDAGAECVSSTECADDGGER